MRALFFLLGAVTTAALALVGLFLYGRIPDDPRHEHERHIAGDP